MKFRQYVAAAFVRALVILIIVSFLVTLVFHRYGQPAAVLLD